MTRKPISRGDMISTLCFLGAGLWSLGTALDAPPLKGFLLILCALACFVGVVRHKVARLLDRD